MSTTQLDPCGGFDLDAVVLSQGRNVGSRYEGKCSLIEAASLAAACIPELRERFGGEGAPGGDGHPSISRVVREVATMLNDQPWESDQERTDALKPYVTRVLGTASSEEAEQARAWLAADWLVRTEAPVWLRLVGLAGHARRLEDLAPLTGAASADAARPALDAACEAASAAHAAARAASGETAWSAYTSGAAYATAIAGGTAALDALDAAGDAIWASSGTTLGPGGDATRAAAGKDAVSVVANAAFAAAWDAVKDTPWSWGEGDDRWDTWSALREAAWEALRPTAHDLRASTLRLLDAMIALGRS